MTDVVGAKTKVSYALEAMGHDKLADLLERCSGEAVTLGFEMTPTLTIKEGKGIRITLGLEETDQDRLPLI